MQALRINSRSLLSSGRFHRLHCANVGEIRKYSRQAASVVPRLSGCLCNVHFGGSRSFLLPSYNQFLPTTAALSLFSRSSPKAPGASENVINTSDLPYPLEEIGPIPEAPPVPSADTLRALRTSIADNMREIGLANYMTPPGWIQNLLDLLHSSTGLPWWEVIVLSTIIVRTCTLPVMIYSQRRTGLMALHQEEVQPLMKKAEEARKSGDPYEYQMAMLDVQEYMKEKGLPSPYKMMIPLAANGFVFMSYFLALRGMAKASLWSMKFEGTLWFPDLTIGDPTIILPAICAVTLLAMVEVGVEFGTGVTTMSPGMRWFIRLMPLSLLVFGKMMPAAVLCYWVTSNTMSLIISSAFRIPKVRTLLKFPPLAKRKAKSWSEKFALPESVKNFFADPRVLWYGIKNWRKNRATRAPSADQIRSSDSKRFKAAGEGPMPPTFTFNPKTKYREVFEKKSFVAKLKSSMFGEKKTAVKRKAAG